MIMIYKHTYFYFCKYIQNVHYSEKLRVATIKNGLSYSFITHQIASQEFNYLYSFKFETPGCKFVFCERLTYFYDLSSYYAAEKRRTYLGNI